jgi:hypothetical protein
LNYLSANQQNTVQTRQELRFKKAKLPAVDLEKRAKLDVYRDIEAATTTAKPKGKYGKARDSFKLLGQIDPDKLKRSCWWADRFLAALKKY